MNNWQIALIAIQVLSALFVVSIVGRPREPITPPVAVGVLILDALIIFAIVKAGG